MATPSASSPREYVLSLDLPDVARAVEAARAVKPKVKFSKTREAVAVGAQLTEFSEAVPANVRAAIADSVLLAQLAANKAKDQSDDLFGWYDKYTEVLQNIGWQMRDLQFETQHVSDQHAGVHKAIIPVIIAALGPAAAAASIVVGVLNGLQEMDTTTPWITLFDRASQHSHGAKFQVSYVDANDKGDPEITLLCFGIDAQRTITQVLFFKFSGESADVRQATGKLSVNMKRLNSASDAIAKRVQSFVTDYIKNVDI